MDKIILEKMGELLITLLVLSMPWAASPPICHTTETWSSRVANSTPNITEFF